MLRPAAAPRAARAEWPLSPPPAPGCAECGRGPTRASSWLRLSMPRAQPLRSACLVRRLTLFSTHPLGEMRSGAPVPAAPARLVALPCPSGSLPAAPCCSASPSHGRYLECNFESPPFVDPCIVPLSRNARRLRPAGLWPASRRLSRFGKNDYVLVAIY